MKKPLPYVHAAGTLAVIVTAAYAPAAAQTRADGGPPAYTAADVQFMSGMIGHHAQAVLMAGWAPSHGARQSVRALCERIVVGQREGDSRGGEGGGPGLMIMVGGQQVDSRAADQAKVRNLAAAVTDLANAEH